MSQGILVIDVGRLARRRCHPGGDRGSSLGANRAEAIIRVMTSVAGYRYHYPYMSNAPHNGPLMRPEQVASPVHRAFRQRNVDERPCRFPAKRAREHQQVVRMTRAEWIKRAAQEDTNAPVAVEQQKEPGFNQEEMVDTPKEEVIVSQDANDLPSNHSSGGVRVIRDRILRVVRKHYRKLSCKTKVPKGSVEVLSISSQPKNVGSEVCVKAGGGQIKKSTKELINEENNTKTSLISKTPGNAFSRFASRIHQKITKKTAAN